MSLCLDRRNFLLAGGAVVGALPLMSFRGMAAHLMRRDYEPKRLCAVADAKLDEVLEFTYPHEDVFSRCFLVKLGTKASGGAGADEDIVAFSNFCAHMGGSLAGRYVKDHKVMGPCPLHLTTYDLTRHGMVVAGHATETLPQIVLEVRGDDLWATAVQGLIYGYHDNQKGN